MEEFLTQIMYPQKEFETKNLGEYHDLYVQNDTLLLTDVFEKFTKMCINIYELDPGKYFFCLQY